MAKRFSYIFIFFLSFAHFIHLCSLAAKWFVEEPEPDKRAWNVARAFFGTQRIKWCAVNVWLVEKQQTCSLRNAHTHSTVQRSQHIFCGGNSIHWAATHTATFYVFLFRFRHQASMSSKSALLHSRVERRCVSPNGIVLAQNQIYNIILYNKMRPNFTHITHIVPSGENMRVCAIQRCRSVWRCCDTCTQT